MAVTSITGQATPTVKTCGISGANGISSSTTVTRLSSTTISNVSSATIKTTPSTTQTVNSSKTSSVKYSSATISSSTTIASSTISSKTASTTAGAISSSTTSRVASTTISSSTTVASSTISSKTASTTAGAISSSTTSRIASTTVSSSTTASTTAGISNASSASVNKESNASASSDTTSVVIKMYSSATPQGKDVVIEVPAEQKESKIGDIEIMINNNIKERINDNIQIGMVYNLGEIPIAVGDPSITCSAEIEFHDDDTEAVISYLPEINASVTELRDFVKDTFSVEFFNGGAISIDKESMSMSIEKDGYLMEINMMSLLQQKWDITFSKSTELGKEATLTNSINIIKDIKSDDVDSFLEKAWDTVCEGAQRASEWIVDNACEIGIVVGTIAPAIKKLGTVAVGASTGPITIGSLAVLAIYELYENNKNEVK